MGYLSEVHYDFLFIVIKITQIIHIWYKTTGSKERPKSCSHILDLQPSFPQGSFWEPLG